tara:strand:- start:115 stop:1308 length:1194 start_codon:yes stop_codon:yes gene_type:complete
VYPKEELLQAKIDLLEKTNMVDFALDIHKELRGAGAPAPAALMERREEVVAKLGALQGEVAGLIEFLQDEARAQLLSPDKQYNRAMLEQQHGIGGGACEALFAYAKWQYECGNYALGAEFLGAYERLLCLSGERAMDCQWGKLGAAILSQDFEGAQARLNELRDTIDNKNHAGPLMQLQQRTWLLHWALYVFFNHPGGRSQLLELFLQDRYLNAIQLNAPHLLRYVVAVVIATRGGKGLMKDVIHAVSDEAYHYKDPVTEFLLCLFQQCDFEGAQQRLKECEQLLDQDYFLAALKDDFMESARLHIFETYCRIHQTIDTKMLAEKLNMDSEAAEKWIANLIRNAQLDAKIDSQKGTVVMQMEYPDVYDRLQEKIKDATGRTFTLANSVLGSGNSEVY